jgi:hypothetical protein
MTCTKSVLYAIIEIKIMKDDPEDLLPAELRRKTQTEVLSQSLRESASSAGKSLNSSPCFWHILQGMQAKKIAKM